MPSEVEARGDTTIGKVPAEPSATRPPSSLKKRLIRFAFFLFVMFAILFSAQQHPLLSASTIQQISSGQAAEALAAGSLPGTVLTARNDQLRTGLNNFETVLNVNNVNARHFGKRLVYPVDGAVFAQPLFMPHLLIQGAYHNVVFVATENDSVYAFDADQTQAQGPLWKTSFVAPPAVVPETGNDVYCDDLGPSVGITGTPVIDAKTMTLYVVAATREHGKYFSRLHALDLLTGQEKAHSPATITASVPGRSKDASHGRVTFNPLRENQRPGLLLLNGVVYIAYGSYCDLPPYSGWLMGYNASSLQQVSVYNPDPDVGAAGIWQGGTGLAADAKGNIYLETGEGDFNLNQGGRDAGDSLLKLSTVHGLHVVDSFTSFNQLCLGWGNLDLGSAGPLLLPGGSEVIGTGKEGRLYVLDAAHLGGYHTVIGPCAQLSLTTVDQVKQELPPDTVPGGVWGALAYWNGPNGQYIYASGLRAETVQAFKLTNGLLSSSPASQSPVERVKGKPVRVTGNPVVSSDGTRVGTGIVWLIDRSGFLRAYDAGNLAHEIYSSGQNQHRDSLGAAVKFSVPTVANGKVFVGTTNSLVIYGLLG